METINYLKIREVVGNKREFIHKHQVLRELNQILAIEVVKARDSYLRDFERPSTSPPFEELEISSEVSEAFVRLSVEIVNLRKLEDQSKSLISR
jgi:hypothetical protein